MEMRATTRQRLVGEVYSDLAPLWSAHDRERTDAIDLMARRVVRALRPGGNVLDVGCGTGAQLARIRAEARRRGRRIGLTVGVDLARSMVQRSRRRRGVRALPADGLGLPFADQVFDVVLGSHVLHLMGDPEKAAREMFRVSSPGGTIVIELPAAHDRAVRRFAHRLPATSLLRRYLELPRMFRVAAFRWTLAELGCEVQEVRLRAPHADSPSFLARVAKASGSEEDRAAAPALAERAGRLGRTGACRVLVARVPGPRTGRMPVSVVGLPGWTPRRVSRLLSDLPVARGYRVIVKPLRWRSRPHVQAFCEFDRKQIVIQVPVPFRPFSEYVPYRAQRTKARGFVFRWHWRRLRFERPHELIRYLYLHEYYHWYLREVMGKASGAETACDRFALQRMKVRTTRRAS